MPQAKERETETKERSEETKPRREKGTGTLWKKENGTWMGRVDIGRNAEGKRKYKNFSGKTEAEVKRKIREYNKSGKHIDENKITVGAYIQNWLPRLYDHGGRVLHSEGSGHDRGQQDPSGSDHLLLLRRRHRLLRHEGLYGYHSQGAGRGGGH